MLKFLKFLLGAGGPAIILICVVSAIDDHKAKVRAEQACEWGVLYACSARGCTIPLAKELFRWCQGKRPNQKLLEREGSDAANVGR
jgi:hypothetical protein